MRWLVDGMIPDYGHQGWALVGPPEPPDLAAPSQPRSHVMIAARFHARHLTMTANQAFEDASTVITPDKNEFLQDVADKGATFDFVRKEPDQKGLDRSPRS